MRAIIPDRRDILRAPLSARKRGRFFFLLFFYATPSVEIVEALPQHSRDGVLRIIPSIVHTYPF